VDAGDVREVQDVAGSGRTTVSDATVASPRGRIQVRLLLQLAKREVARAREPTQPCRRERSRRARVAEKQIDDDRGKAGECRERKRAGCAESQKRNGLKLVPMSK
jgi:hypothetical protein